MEVGYRKEVRFAATFGTQTDLLALPVLALGLELT